LAGEKGGGPKGFAGRFDRHIWVLFVARLINSFGFSIVMPFISIYLAMELGVPTTIIGTLYAVSTGVSAVAQLVGGELSDRLGRKKVLLFSVGLRSLVFVLMAASVSLAQPSLVTISVLIIAGSFLGGLYRPTLDVLVADYVGPEKRAEAYSLQRIAGNLGFALGPMVGGLAATLSYSILFLVTAACNLVTFFLILAFITEPKVKRSGQKFRLSDMTSIARDRPFLAYSMTSLLLFVVSSQLMVTLSVFSIKDVGISKIEMGTLFTLNGLMIVVLQYGVTALFNGVRLTTALAAGSCIYAFGYLSVGFASSYYHLLLSMGVITLGELIAMPSAVTLVANLAPVEQRGRYMGFFGLSTDTGSSIGPFAGGVLMDQASSNHLILWGPVCAMGLCASVGYLSLGRVIGGREKPQDETGE